MAKFGRIFDLRPGRLYMQLSGKIVPVSVSDSAVYRMMGGIHHSVIIIPAGIHHVKKSSQVVCG